MCVRHPAQRSSHDGLHIGIIHVHVHEQFVLAQRGIKTMGLWTKSITQY